MCVIPLIEAICCPREDPITKYPAARPGDNHDCAIALTSQSTPRLHVSSRVACNPFYRVVLITRQELQALENNRPVSLWCLLRFLHNVFLCTGKEIQYFSTLLGRHFEFVQGIFQRGYQDFPILLINAHAFMG